MKSTTITGIILDSTTKTGIANLRIEAWDKDMIIDDLLSQAESDEQGKFELTFSEKHHKEFFIDRKTDIYFKVFHGEKLIHSTEKEVLWNVKDKSLNIQLEVEHTPQQKAAANKEILNSVSGVISTKSGVNVVNAVVKVYSKTLQKETLLASTTTDVMGNYRLEYPQGEAKNIVVRVFNSKEEEPIASSEIILNAKEEELLNLTIENTSYKGLSLFEVLEKTSSKHIGKTPIENLTAEELSLLSAESRLTVEYLEMYQKAKQQSLALPYSAKLLFALVYYNTNIEEDNLLQLSEGQLKHLIAKSWNEHVIAKNNSTQIMKEIAEHGKRVIQQQLLNSSFTSGIAIQDVWALAKPTKKQLESLGEKMIHSDGSNFWEKLNEDDSLNSLAAELKQLTQLNNLTFGNLPLVETIHAQPKVNSIKDLAGWTEEEWLSMINEENIPSEIEDTSSNRTLSYAKSMKKMVDYLHPNKNIAVALSKEENLSTELRNDYATFFQNNSEINFNTLNVTDFFSKNKDALKGVKKKDELKADLKQTIRLARLTPQVENYKNIALLKGMGVNKSTDILKKGVAEFERAFNLKGGDLKDALIIYGLAQNRAAQLSVMQLKFKTDLELQFYVFNNGISEDPNWKNFFGSEEYCACSHCKSVYSPAAYLADSLQFLEKNNVYEKFDQRRPDVKHLLLNCENANTAMPYIDLVNEVLEAAIVGENDSRNQTTLSVNELMASPEHIKPEAYNLLKTKTYPWSMPFDLDNRLGKSYLKHLGVEHHKLVELFRTANGDENAEKEKIKATLALNETNWELLLAESYDNKENEYWGISGGESIEQTTGIQFFLDKSQLRLSELEDLSKSKFIGKVAAFSFNYENPCSLENAEINNLSSANRKQIFQFIRLQKKLNTNIRTTDYILNGLKISRINASALSKITQLVLWQQTFNIPYEELISWVGTLPTKHSKDAEQHKELYEKLFLSKTEGYDESIPPLFQLTGDEQYAFRDEEETNSIKSYIQGALQIGAEDLNTLFHQIQVEHLSIKVLSEIYGYVSLSRALKISITDLLLIQSILNYTSGSEIERINTTLRFLTQLKENGYETKEALFLFDRNSENQLSENKKVEILQEIREGVWKFHNQGAEQDEENTLSPLSVEDFIFEKLSITFGLNRNIVRLLLQTENEDDAYLMHLSNEEPKPFYNSLISANFTGEEMNPEEILQQIEPGQFPQLEVLCSLLNKIALIFKNTEWQESDYELFLSEQGKTDWINFNAFQNVSAFPELVDNFIQFMNIKQIVEATPAATIGVLDVLNTAEGETEEWKLKMTQLFGDEKAIPDPLFLGMDGFSNPEDYLKLISIHELEKHLEFSVSNHKNNANKFSWAVADLNTRLVNEIIQTAKAKYGKNRWQIVTKQLRDSVREEQRDALLTYAKSQFRNSRGERLDSPEKLYARFLIDMEMSACTVTSRIKLAISAVQLFVQRCLMSLESDINLGNLSNFEKLEWHEWAWRKNYRVWEANRKVFLYPENWLEPEWRDDKSVFFEELEEQLQQNEMTSLNAEAAYRDYLMKLDMVSNLEIMAICEAERINNILSGYYIFGRTYGTPRSLYFRKYTEKTNSFSAWEKIEVGFEGNHLLPAIHKGRLHLFWPVFGEKKREGAKENDGYRKPIEEKTIQLAWTQFYNGKWESKTLTDESIQLDTRYYNDIWEDLKETLYFQYKDETVLLFQMFQFDDFDGFHVRVERRAEAIPTEIFNSTNNRRLKSKFIHRGEFDLSKKKTRVLTEDPNLTQEFIQLFIEHYDLSYFYERRDGIAKLQVRNQRLYSDSAILPTLKNLLFRKRAFIKEFSEEKISLIPSSDLIYPSVGLSPFIVESQKVGVLFLGGTIIPLQGTIYSDLLEDINFKRLISDTMDAKWQVYQKDTFQISDYININPFFVVNSEILNNPIELHSSPAFKQYHWELFFHIPIHIANKLRQDQKFEEAQKWFHLVFNPTSTEDAENPKKFWLFLPFRELVGSTGEGTPNSIQELMNLLNEEENNQEVQEFERQVREWEENPFSPHTVARSRIIAYMKWVVMRYVDTLIEWADQLFRRDSIESLNEATQLYMLAWNILGTKPKQLSEQQRADKSYEQLKKDGLDEFSNTMVELETSLMRDATLTSPAWGHHPELEVPNPSNPIKGEKKPIENSNTFIVPNKDQYFLAHTGLYFCIPQNEKLISYWSLVQDRFFKLRNCLNIEGIYRQLPLYEPPIDPALLVKARAAGLSIADALSAQYNSNSHYRFQVLLQKAVDYANDVRAFGSALLAAMEKRDVEKISVLRSQFEVNLLNSATLVRKEQIRELETNREVLSFSQSSIEYRKDYYGNKEFMNAEEKKQDKLTKTMNTLQIASQAYSLMASAIRPIPDIQAGYSGLGGHFATNVGGEKSAAVIDLFAQASSMGASIAGMQASKAGQTASYKRRQEDWRFQESSAEIELKQIEKQILASEIRTGIAEQELKNHELQVENSKKQLELVKSKFTNEALYSWMVGQLKTLYFQSYQMAFDMAKKAEKALKNEQSTDDAESLIQFGYWDNLKQGLLSGEKLHHDLKRMEMIYMQRNKRKQEVSQTFSLAMIKPSQLIELRATGECNFEIPTIYFDLAYQNHKNRKVKSVSITIPAITGPYTGVHATLTNNLEQISTSSAQNDNGLFQFNFNEERTLPFEGLNPDSNWTISMNSEFRAFDYNTISDVLLHINYTADVENNAEVIRTKRENLLQSLSGATLTRFFSLKNEFAGEWFEAKKNEGELIIPIKKSMFPYTMQQPNFDIVQQDSVYFTVPLVANAGDGNAELTIDENEDNNVWEVNLGEIENLENIDDILLVLKYTVG